MRCGKPPACSMGREFLIMTRQTRCVVTTPGRRLTLGGSGAYLPAFDSQTVRIMAPRLRELIALSLLAGLGFGLALAHGDLLFVAVFGGTITMTSNAIRRLW